MLSTIVLLIGVGLGVLWLIALTSTAVAVAWYTWLVFAAAVLLIIVGAAGLRRRL